ncbi:dTMP kinase [Chitinispirillales bacterium ANBcel5]|uniref:dTMP kinase n=1 Tax=Cellulosispirillum alkaliphilum TaxID=3039283 RepID=UPI002A510959|nr:dTMP kinase [Chitinispirillales bacterium ANBcel5]
MKKGMFIAFEGIDGCGKSTQLSLVAKRLEERGIVPVVTREPGGTPVSEAIREILIAPRFEEMCIQSELLLYLAARAQHMREKIQPALLEGEVVLCDRFQAATFAYQGYGRGISIDTLKMFNEFSTGGIKPDCTFIFDISVQCSRKRLSAMGKARDRLENGSEEFFKRIRNGYLEIAETDPNVVLFDGSKEVELLNEQVFGKICQLIEV